LAAEIPPQVVSEPQTASPHYPETINYKTFQRRVTFLKLSLQIKILILMPLLTVSAKDKLEDPGQPERQ